MQGRLRGAYAWFVHVQQRMNGGRNVRATYDVGTNGWKKSGMPHIGIITIRSRESSI